MNYEELYDMDLTEFDENNFDRKIEAQYDGEIPYTYYS